MRKKGQHQPSTLQQEAKTRSIPSMSAYAEGTGNAIAPHRSDASTPTDRPPRNEDRREPRRTTVSRPSAIHGPLPAQGTAPHGVGTDRAPDTIPAAHGEGAHRPHDGDASLPRVGRCPHHAGCLALCRYACRPDHVLPGPITPTHEEDHRLQQEGPMSEERRTNAPPYSSHQHPSNSENDAPTRCPRSRTVGYRTDSISSPRTHTQKDPQRAYTKEGKDDRSHTRTERKGGLPTAHHPRRTQPTHLPRHRSQPTNQPPTSRPRRPHLLCPSRKIPNTAGGITPRMRPTSQSPSERWDTESSNPTNSSGISRCPTHSDAPLEMAYIGIRDTQPTLTSPIPQEGIRHRTQPSEKRIQEEQGSRIFPLPFLPNVSILTSTCPWGYSQNPHQ